MTTIPRTTSSWFFFGPLVLVVVLAVVIASQGYLELSLDGFEATQLGRLFLIVLFVAAAIERAVEVYVHNVFGATRLALNRDVAIAQRRVDTAEGAVTRETQRQATPGVALDDAAVQARREQVSTEQDRLLEAIDERHDPLIQHQTRTATRAATLAVALGFAAAAVGVRLLGQFLHVDGSSLADALTQCQDCQEGSPSEPPGATPPSAGGTAADDVHRTTCMQAFCARLASQIFWFRAVDIVLTTLVLAGGADGIHQIIRRATTAARSA